MGLKGKYLKQRRGHKKLCDETSDEQESSSSSLWVAAAYSYIMRKAKAFYKWICNNGSEEVDPYFSVPVLPPN